MWVRVPTGPRSVGSMDWIDVLEREGSLLSAAARHDAQAEVPTCPGWLVDDLLRHVSVTHRWSERIVRERMMQRPDLETPPSHDSLSWYEAGLAQLVATLRDADPTESVWTFSPSDRTIGFWARRQAHETQVHRVDAELATGAVSPIDPAVAVDGISEVLEVIAPRLAKQVATAGGTVHLHATDIEGEWLVRFLDGAVEVEQGHAKGDAAVRAAAADLYLWLWGRKDDSGLEVFGDPSAVDRLVALTRV